jgi:hypothetical protein
VRSPRIDPQLQPLYDAAQAILAASKHHWSMRLAVALRHCRLRLRDGRGGYTIPFYWLGLNVIWIGRELAASGVNYHSLHTLLHEAAHQCGAVLPEWKIWFGRWGGRFEHSSIYGDAVNSADAIATAILQDASTVQNCRDFLNKQEISG